MRRQGVELSAPHIYGFKVPIISTATDTVHRITKCHDGNANHPSYTSLLSSRAQSGVVVLLLLVLVLLRTYLG